MEEKQAQSLIHKLLKYIGEDPNREGLIDTPDRITRSYKELFKGYKMDAKEVLSTTFSSDYDQMVILKGIDFYSFCEHHWLPFFGKVSIAYIPQGRVVGISKLARLVEVYSRRLQIQEEMTEQIANAIKEHLQPLGIAVHVEAQHFCMVARGIKKQNARMVTNKLTGVFLEKDNNARTEFLRLLT